MKCPFTCLYICTCTNIFVKVMSVLDLNAKGPSMNVNILMSVQTVHFFLDPLPPSPKVYRPTSWDSETRVSGSTFIVQQQILTPLPRQFDIHDK